VNNSPKVDTRYGFSPPFLKLNFIYWKRKYSTDMGVYTVNQMMEY